MTGRAGLQATSSFSASIRDRAHLFFGVANHGRGDVHEQSGAAAEDGAVGCIFFAGA